MPLSAEALKDLQALYCQEFGVELTEAEAEAMAQELLHLFRLAHPLSRAHTRTCPRHRTPPPSQAAS